jgi:hypothetical protein
MSLIRYKTVGKVLDQTVYYIGVSFGEREEGISFEITYVHHNGYTRIRAVTHQKLYKGFGQWFNDYNSRWSQNWNKKQIFNRKRKITSLAFEKIEQAYATYLLENQLSQDEQSDRETITPKPKDKEK